MPAAAAGLAYLNARWRLPEDIRILKAVIGATIAFKRRERQDRINSFYILEDHANNPKVADKLFLIYENQTWTFKQTYDIVLRYAGWLHSTHNVTKGEFVAINMVNSAEMLFTILAVWSLGAIPALINYNLTGQGFTHSVKAASARLLVTEPEIEAKTLDDATRAVVFAANFRNDSFPLEVAVLDEALTKSLNYFQPYRAPDAARSGLIGRSPQVLIFTSGTTGLPKPALVTWERTQTASDTVYRWLGLRNVTTSNPDRYYTAMPIYHSSGFQLNFHACLMGACTSVLGRRFSVSNFWNEVIRNEATAIQYVGETLRYLLANPPHPDDRTRHKVRLAFGNGLRADVWERFRSRFGVETIVEFYGATEGVGGTFNFNRNSFSSGAIGANGSVVNLVMGPAFAFVKVDWDTEEPYRDPKTGFCVKVPTGEPGELLAKLDEKDIGAKFQGYHGSPEATKKKLMRDVFKKGDAYFRTGDVIVKDSEYRLWFSDRIGDTFRWKSENVSTAQVGEVLGHHPRVQEANVYGVSLPGYEGRAGCAAVMLDASSFGPNGGLKPEVLESLATWCTNSLPRFAVPIFIRTVKELVVTGTNKQQKPKLRQEGVQPDRMGSDKLYWLKPGSSRYEPFTSRGWSELVGGVAKL